MQLGQWFVTFPVPGTIFLKTLSVQFGEEAHIERTNNVRLGTSRFFIGNPSRTTELKDLVENTVKFEEDCWTLWVNSYRLLESKSGRLRSFSEGSNQRTTGFTVLQLHCLDTT